MTCGKKVFIVCLALSLLFLAGCGFIKDILPGSDTGDVDGKPSVQTETDLAPENLGPAEESWALGETVDVTLYFADPTGNELVPETRTIEKVEGIGRAAINELISGPGASSQLLPTVPEGTVLLDINVKDTGLCIVDFNRELMQPGAAGVIPEELTVYSIVDTLTQFPTVDEVQFRIEGQVVDTLGGTVSVLEPLHENLNLVE